MCVVGLYLVFLLLEDVIVGFYTTDAASEDQEKNIKAAYEFFQKDRVKSSDSDNFFRQNNGRKPFRFVLNISTTPERPFKQRQVARVTQKQYEIINMLWRKTKIFLDEKDIYTPKPTQKNNVTQVTLKRFKDNNLLRFPAITTSTQMTTSSKIEFYYLDDMEAHVEQDICVELNSKNNTARNMSSNTAKEASNPPFLVFHLTGPYAKPKSSRWNSSCSNNSYFINDQLSISGIKLNKPQKVTQQVKLDVSSLKKETNMKIIEKATHRVVTRKKYLGNAYLKHTTKPTTTVHNLNGVHIYNVDQNDPKSTTVYDKIKFFEMYDKNTQPPKNPIKGNKLTKTAVDDEKVILNDRNMVLEDIDQENQELKQAKHSKKHITDHSQNSFNKSWLVKTYPEIKKSRSQIIDVTMQTNEMHISNENLTKFVPNDNKSVFSYTNKNASWSDYPFAAVYINEQSQVHCDAAGISAHWLVVSGSCLSRVSKKLDGDGRSAFVVYCGELWWQPERVAYVKYSIVHPWYHPRDKSRRHLYNIGVIQVVNSMLSCSGWAPISLISHQFAADPEGSWALAVGWGLDRFDTRYGATDLPRNPLTTYKGLLYFDSCPGNIGYSKAKRLDEGGGVRNVHCLSLPPYTGEDSDPVHGGLLLVGGKLIALYLQEERRPWGEQSAQYTGVWRLIPWVMNVAREPEEIDTSIFEI